MDTKSITQFGNLFNHVAYIVGNYAVNSLDKLEVFSLNNKKD
jgi:hypothetical protein